MTDTQIHDPKSFASQLPDSARTAFFNPFKEERQNALTNLRASAPYTADEWARLDLAAGIDRPDLDKEKLVEITADSTLQIDSWEDVSTSTLTEQFVQSTAVDQLISDGFGVNSSLSRYVYIDTMRNVHLDAEVDMNPRARATQDMPTHGFDGVPLPVVHVDYELDGREYENAQAHGESFDESVGTEARRAANRREARMLWDGWGGNVQTERGVFGVGGLDVDDGGTKIIQTASTAAAGWDDPAVLLDDIDHMHDQIEGQTDVEDTDDIPMVSEVGAILWVPRTQWGNVERSDYESSATDEPVIDRINRKYNYLDIRPAPRLSDDSAVMMLRDPRYFQVVNAQSPTNTSWEVDGGFGLRNKLISSRVPFVRRQPDGIRGIVRMTGV